ncbi:MAG: hypothetical protein HYZ31_01190, partial [Gammaproteobacteria bacterium]|nr:hypothetical protein [Gammaproteobacteria bacterium]
MIDVYLGNSQEPSFSRLADRELMPQLLPQGMLQTISKTDLENTDIYIYRVSTGQRIAELEGLEDSGGASEIDGGLLTGYNGASTYRGVHENETIATFGFTSLVLGA